MDEKSLRLLEFPKVRQILAGFTSFSASKELAQRLKPSSDNELVSKLLAQTKEARYLRSQIPSISAGGVLDIRGVVRKAAVGQIMATEDLLSVRYTLEAVRDLRTDLVKLKDDIPLLWNIAEPILPLPEIEREISKCIGPRGEVLDSASNRLSNIRRELKETRRRLIAKLERILETPSDEDFIQEQLIVERNGRYVLPIKVEMQSRLKGIVHDISNTGATVFIEPWATVELGNELRQLAAEEEREIERILTALTNQVGDQREAISRNIALTAEIDLALAKAKYAEKLWANKPVIRKSSGSKHRASLKLIDARHPLLKGKVVPLSVEIGGDFSVLVITGPNTGGKTVALKTIGLLVLMAQAGMHIPASEDSYISIFDDVFADIGDEQSIEQTLSTFSWHITNINRIIEHSSGGSLVLLDELGGSTDPTEGAALARAILQHFLSKKAMVVTTTHYSDLKLMANAIPGMQNASLDFDPVTLTPIYRLTMGLSGGSNALDIAARLGLPPGIIEAARNAMQDKDQEIEEMLGSLKAERQVIIDLKNQAEKERAETEDLRSKLEGELQTFQEEKQDMLREARDNMQQTRYDLSREAAELRKQLSKAESELKRTKSPEKAEQARKALANWQETMSAPAWKPSREDLVESVKEYNLSPGDKVWLKDMNSVGTVVSLRESSGKVEVRVGQTTLLLDIDRVEKTGKSEAKPLPQRISPKMRGRNVPLELDLRGRRADDVSPELDMYLNDASLARLREVRIVHGIGTGTVSQIVRDTLSSHPLVESFRPGGKEEGGDGVTVVRL